MPQQIAEEIGSGEKDLEPVFDTLKTYCEKHELPIIPYVVIDHELKETIKNFPSRYKEYFNQQLFWVYDYEWGSMENPFKPLA